MKITNFSFVKCAFSVCLFFVGISQQKLIYLIFCYFLILSLTHLRNFRLKQHCFPTHQMMNSLNWKRILRRSFVLHKSYSLQAAVPDVAIVREKAHMQLPLLPPPRLVFLHQNMTQTFKTRLLAIILTCSPSSMLQRMKIFLILFFLASLLAPRHHPPAQPLQVVNRLLPLPPWRGKLAMSAMHLGKKTKSNSFRSSLFLLYMMHISL